jgi:hypothetical protein
MSLLSIVWIHKSASSAGESCCLIHQFVCIGKSNDLQSYRNALSLNVHSEGLVLTEMWVEFIQGRGFADLCTFLRSLVRSSAPRYLDFRVSAHNLTFSIQFNQLTSIIFLNSLYKLLFH